VKTPTSADENPLLIELIEPFEQFFNTKNGKHFQLPPWGSRGLSSKKKPAQINEQAAFILINKPSAF